MSKALLVLDVQNDFYEDGSLPVKEASKINPVINGLMESDEYDFIIASQDWHPADHKSYAVNQGEEPFTPFDNGKGIGPILWPVHCQMGTRGAAFHEDINTIHFDYIIRKGTDPEVDSYSMFRENNGFNLGMDSLLRGLNIDEVDTCGLALDYCVRDSTLDAVKFGFKTNLIINASRGVEANPGDVDKTLEAFRKAGVVIKEY